MLPKSLLGILNNRLIHALFLRYKLGNLRRAFAPLEQEAQALGIALLGPMDLPGVDHSKFKACHIIGSGWSLDESRHLALRDDAYVMGFNFSALCKLPYQLYFTEFGGEACEAIAIRQRNLLDASVLPRCNNVYMKNLGTENNDLRFAQMFYQGRVKFVRDILLPCAYPVGLHDVMGVLLSDDDHWFHQYASSVLTLVASAKKMGFRDIVIHGVDFGGPYFFDSEDYIDQADCMPPKVAGYNHIRGKKTDSHPTQFHGMGLRESLEIINRIGSTHGIRLFSATPISPLSEILPVYDPLSTEVP
jgi:hypothetical protein